MNKLQKTLKKFGIKEIALDETVKVLTIPNYSKEVLRIVNFYHEIYFCKECNKNPYYYLSYYGYLPTKKKKTGLKTLRKNL